MTSSKRLSVLILIAVVAAIGLMVHLMRQPDAPPMNPDRQAGEKPARDPATVGPSPISPERPTTTSEVIIDPALQAAADRLNDAEASPQRDLEIVSEFLSTYSKALGGNPIGDNADITSALTGSDGHKGRVFPPNHRTIQNGRLVDRWGTPYWFHPNSGNQMEVRSAGPDRQLFTQDDVILNPSPAGLGATPASADPPK